MKKKKTKIVWTKEKCHKEALKYEFKYEFFEKSNTAYTASIRNGWHKEISKHLKKKIKPAFLTITIEECKKDALKYDTRKKFAVNSTKIYQISRKNGWLDIVCSHMLELVKPKGFWNIFENCKTEALKHNTRNDFSIKSNRAYKMSLKYGWLDDISSHMIDARQIESDKRRIWTKEKCREEALKHNLKTKVNSAAQNTIRKNGWEDEFYSHMKHPHKNYKKHNYWTKEKCHKEALNYDFLYIFKNHCGSAYNSAYKNKWLIDICSHMKKPHKNYKKHNHWTKEKCHEEALKYNTKSKLYYGNASVYQKAILKGWLNDICSHMKKSNNAI